MGIYRHEAKDGSQATRKQNGAMRGAIRTTATRDTSTCSKSRQSFHREQQFEPRLRAVHKNKPKLPCKFKSERISKIMAGEPGIEPGSTPCSTHLSKWAEARGRSIQLSYSSTGKEDAGFLLKVKLGHYPISCNGLEC